MSTRTQAILDQVKALPDDERREVCEQIIDFEARVEGWEKQKARIREMQARYAGSGLLSRLLDERNKDRARER
jgi:hypothetical protein